MDNNTISVVIAAVGGAISGVLGKPFWDAVTNKQRIKAENNSKVVKLEEQVKQLRQAFEMVLVTIGEEFDDRPSMKNLIDKAHEIIMKEKIE